MPSMADHLAALRDAYATVDPFDETTTETALRSLAGERGIKAGPLIHATRVALTGRAQSPGLFEVMCLLGRGSTLSRLSSAVTHLRRD
jgi:nondiscriminating glutamyl-tRNA synthetase